MPASPKPPKSFLKADSEGHLLASTGQRRRTSESGEPTAPQPTDPPAFVASAALVNNNNGGKPSGATEDGVQAKIWEKARNMTKTDSVDDMMVDGRKKDKKKKSKRKEEEKPDPLLGQVSSEGSDHQHEKRDKKPQGSDSGAEGPDRKERKSKSSSKGSESGDEGPDRRERRSRESKASKDVESGDEGQERSRGRKAKPWDDELGGTKTKTERTSSRSRSRSRSSPRGDKEKDSEKKDRKREKKKRLDLNDPSHGLQAALRAESRARGRDISKKKDSKDKKLEDGTYKPYHDMDDSESTNNSDDSGKKKKKKSKKRTSSSDRGIKSSRDREKPEAYEPSARVTHRSRSGERMQSAESQDPGGAPDPVIGPGFDPPPDSEPVSPSVKRKKKKKPDHDRELPPSSMLPDPDSDQEDSDHGEEMAGKSDKKLEHPVDDDATPRVRNRTSHSTEESASSTTTDHSTQSPKPGPKDAVDPRARRASPRTPKKDSVKMTRRHSNQDGRGKAPLHSSPGKGSRRRAGSRNEADAKSLTPTKRTPDSKRVRKPGEAKIYDSEGKEIRLPIDSSDDDDDAAAEPEKDATPSDKDDATRNNDHLDETSAVQSPEKMEPRPKPKNPKLVQQLRECIRLVSVDETGPAVEASLRGLAEYLAAKATDGSGEQSKLAAEVLLADFHPRSKDGNTMGGAGLAPMEGSAESTSTGTNGEKLVFDPYKPPTPQHNRTELSSEDPGKEQSPTRKHSPMRRQSPIRKQNSAHNISEPPLASNGDAPANTTVAPVPPNHTANQRQSLPNRRQSAGPGAPTNPPAQQPPHAFVPQQNWTEEQRRQAYAQYQGRQQYYAQQQHPRPRGPPAPPQNFHQQNVPNQQYFSQHHGPRQGHPNVPYGNAQHPGRANPPHGGHPPDPRAAHTGQYQHPPQQGYARPHVPSPFQQHLPPNQQVPPSQHQQYRPQPQAPYQQQHPQHPYPQQHFHHPQGHPNAQNNPPPPRPPQQPAYNFGRQESSGSGSSDGAMTPLKQSILREWALIPPAMQALRPIEHLIVTVHEVFPPRFGVPVHAHFSTWTAVPVSALWTDGSRLDEKALKKKLRNFKVFLHPDKLPNDFTDSQSFVCKLLWDVIQDAETEYKRKVEELDWVQ